LEFRVRTLNSEPRTRNLLYNPCVINAEIVIVGNEVLLGQVQDTNSSYLGRTIRARGGVVRHIAVVQDEIDSIADALMASLNRRAGLIFTCGGLGPTHDDLTLASLAAATSTSLELNAVAREFVERKYASLASAGFVESAELNDARLKMAMLPAGAIAIENPVGSAPAVVVVFGETRIVALPGVPAELKAIVEGPLQALLNELFGPGGYRERELFIDCGDESILAPALREVAAAHPKVYVKSHASDFGPAVRFRVVVSATASSVDEAQRLIATAAFELIRVLSNAGIEVQ
jgi:nicotinamide-nucleotide amidase